jgi:carboxypeptidase C (cathepsin A)
VAGFRTEFNEAQFVTVHGAGHMVPSTRPEQCLAMLNSFITDKW